MALTVKVAGPGCHLCHLQVGLESTVADAEELIAGTLDVDPEAQHLFCDLEELGPDSRLGPWVGDTGAVELLLVRRTAEQVGWLRELAALEDDEDVTPWLETLPEAGREDRDICLAAVERSPSALAGLSEELRADRGFVLAAVAGFGSMSLPWQS